MKKTKPLELIIEPFRTAEDTYDKVKKYFESGHTPKGKYIHLAKYFINEYYTYSDQKILYPTESDRNYKKWLKKLIIEENDTSEKSIVLNVLKKQYLTKEELENFVFLNSEADKRNPELNQKWHYFISYWGYREYATRHPEAVNETEGIKLLENNYEAHNGNIFGQCEEGRIWLKSVLR